MYHMFEVPGTSQFSIYIGASIVEDPETHQTFNNFYWNEGLKNKSQTFILFFLQFLQFINRLFNIPSKQILK